MGSLSQIKPYDTRSYQHNSQEQKNRQLRNEVSPTIKGVLMNKYYDENQSIYEPTESIYIPSISALPEETISSEQHKETKSFNLNKALTPLLVTTVGLLGGMAGLSYLLKKTAKSNLITPNFEKLPDLAVNMNIKQEPLFATYIALRNPNIKTIAGALGVFAMSGITLIFKNLVDGVKEVWIKKRESDVQRDLQEKLIDTETKAFAGKIQTERNILAQSAMFFEKAFKQNRVSQNTQTVPNAFKSITTFCGSQKEQNNDTNTKKQEGKKISSLSLIGATAIGAIMSALTIKNLKNTHKLAADYTKDFTEQAIKTIEKMATNNNPEDVKQVSKLFEAICAKPEIIKETLTKMHTGEEIIQNVITDVEKSKKNIFSDAPSALGGFTEKIQYYCYLDEDRGHLYNAIMHSENPYLKYLFMASTGISAIGYIANQCADAIKAIAVTKENSNTELSLQNRLIDVEVRNFKAKKESAVKPILEEFKRKQKEGLSNDQLTKLADNMLIEIKNSAPYVYS